MQTHLIAVDPGASGGIAWTDGAGVFITNIPETRGDCISLLRGIVAATPVQWTAYHEKITGFIPDGGATMMFEFGRNVERIGCILETLGVRILEVAPREWQARLALGKVDRQRATADMTLEQKAAVKRHNAHAKQDWKNKLKADAQRRFPGLKVTLKNCDALLILDYARSQP